MLATHDYHRGHSMISTAAQTFYDAWAVEKKKTTEKASYKNLELHNSICLIEGSSRT